ncbi:Protein F53B3.3 [Aphelenchoides avenae]|nr:Protein F53B3.3 [Aphelenchus avenae]
MQSVNAKPMFKGILSRKNSVAAVHHKACLTEATTMECLKLIFDQLATTRDIMLREPTSVAAVLQFVVTGQLDTKCYALEICSMLLDMPRGFQTLFQHLTALAARHAQYKRLAPIMAQIQLGLETRRVHFQLIVARLMNKLISKAPTPSHRMLVLSEATLVNYNSSFIEKVCGSAVVRGHT